MSEHAEGSAEGLLEAWRQRIAAFRINPKHLSYVDQGKVVASGGFGEVKKAVYTGRTRDRSSVVSPPAPNPSARGITVAVKTLTIHAEVDHERLEKRFMREAYVWSQLKNDHIIDFLGYYFSSSEGKTEALLLCPWMENGQSVTYVKQQRLRVPERLQLLLDAAKGLQYLHSRVPPICHGDIKGSNVLIKNDGKAAICDFGLAQALDEEFERLASQTIHRGTVRWTSPERLDDNGPLAPSSDVWSWAWLIWEFMTEKIPFHLISNAAAVIFHIVTLKFPAYDQEAGILEVPTLSKLMQLCWQREPESRLRMDECIERLEQILEGFETHEATGDNQRVFVGTSSFFQPSATPTFPPGPPPASDFATSSSKFKEQFPTVAIPPSRPVSEESHPTITAGAANDRPPRETKPRKELPPLPGQDGESQFFTTSASSYEQGKDFGSNFRVKPRSGTAPENPPSAFTFKGLRSFKRTRTSSSDSSNKAAGIDLKKLKNRFLPSSKRRGQQSGDDEWDWDMIPSQSSPENTESSQAPPYTVSGGVYPVSGGAHPMTNDRYHSNSDVSDLRQQIDYIMRTLQRMESTQEHHSQRQQDLTNYMRQVDYWFSGAPTFASPYVSRQPPPVVIPPGIPRVTTGHPITVTQPPPQPQFMPGVPAYLSSQPQPFIPPPQVIVLQDSDRPSRSRRSSRSSPIIPMVSISPTQLQDHSYSIPQYSGHYADHVEHAPTGVSLLPAIRQFENSEIRLQSQNGSEGKDQAQKGVILETRKTIAIKPVNFQPRYGPRGSERALMSEFNDWLRLWGSLEHENITKMLGSAFVNEVPSVITEWCTDGNIMQYLEKTPQADRRSLLHQAALGLNYLHNTYPRTIHSNLKPKNVLVDGGRVKLADIGILKFLETQDVGAEMHGRMGDARWTAPEILEGRHHRWESDVYSFGCLALFILRDELPYASLKRDVAVSKAIYRGDLPISREAASGLHPTWKLCWAQDPQRRPNMSAILDSLAAW